MRGALFKKTISSVIARIIPADAGSTRLPLLLLHSLWDHPRGCGEHMDDQTRYTRDEGSSPRMRGAQSRARKKQETHGIIPADAGSTCTCSSSFFISEDHPRGCGEHFSKMGAELYGWERIIPADAGST